MHCVHTIITELSELPGVISVEADPKTRQATIKFDAPATEITIKKILSEINYPAVS
jgi:copper chaperone CopZ